MRHLFLSMIALLCATNLAAQQADFPALYDVTGVAASDVLNVRSEPSADSQIIGAFQPDQTDIEVMFQDDQNTGWGRVNVGEQSGWVSLRFLDRQLHRGFPPIRSCFGTEPFWSLTVGRDSLTFAEMGGADTESRRIWRTISANRVGIYGFGAGDFSATLLQESCSDGMSDRAYGLSVHMMTGRGKGTEMVSGCCTLSE